MDLRAMAVGEDTILAMYMNNRAAEALVRGRVDDAYWLAREAIRQRRANVGDHAGENERKQYPVDRMQNEENRNQHEHGCGIERGHGPLAFAGRIGQEAADRITREKNWLKKDLDLKEALGIGYASAKRAHAVAKGGA